MRKLVIVLVTLAIATGPLASSAYADGSPSPSASLSPSPTPSATVAPSPSASGSSTPSTAPSPAASPSAAPSASASASPTPAVSPSASASPSAAPAPSGAASPAPSTAPPSTSAVAAAAQIALPAVDVQRLVTASSLSALIDARTRLAQSELVALQARLASVQADHDATVAELVAYGELVDHRGAIRDRLLRDGLRVAALGGQAPFAVGSEEMEAVTDQVALGAALAERGQRLAADEAELAATIESVAAKRAELARLDAQARALTGGADAGAAQLTVLQSLADDAASAANAIAQLTKGASAAAKPATWSWPLNGVVTQPFGPSPLALEPPIVFHGIAFAHFHDAIDIAAPLGTPVLAAAAGRVTFVGHLPDGAMVVVIAHDDGLVSLSAHLDDAFAPPPVRAGDRVERGQIVGYVGLTGMTTGPHLHFSVHDANGPVDPAVILAAR